MHCCSLSLLIKEKTVTVQIARKVVVYEKLCKNTQLSLGTLEHDRYYSESSEHVGRRGWKKGRGRRIAVLRGALIHGKQALGGRDRALSAARPADPAVFAADLL